jgi:protein-tyrosine phosphatase
MRSDLAEVMAWAPDMVISLTGLEEMRALGTDHLGTALEKHGLAWRHLPIVDFGLPGAAEEALWPMISTEARDWLGRGGRVLVHCKGGCGRSGMAALRLMVEAGEDAGAALARLRAVRPCAVETEAQMDWALAGRRGG